MSDERPDNDGAPRFGRRPRQGNTPPQQHAGEHAHQAPKPKVRIGPRRPDAPPSAPAAPRDPMKPQGGVRKPAGRDGNNGRHGVQGGQQQGGRPQGGQPRGSGNNQQGQQGRRRKKRNKDKFRHPRPEGGFAPPEPREPRPQDDLQPDIQGDLFEDSGPSGASDSSMGDSSAGTGDGGSQGLGRNARRRKRRKERREEARVSEADVFEPAGALDMPSSDSVDVSFEEDESDLNLVEAPPPGSSLPAMSESVEDDEDDDGEDEDVPATDLAPEGAQAAPAGPRESRSKRRRKKRRDRMEAAVVDRSSGFWWADQWTRSFETIYGSGASRARLQKGRSYSRRGQVTELEVGPNGVIARVQGSRPKPYQVRVELNRLRRETWGRILHQLAGKAAFLAQLLEGTLPPEIEDVFFDAGARLFPHGDNDVRSRCTCPDPVVPCKHVAAVHYALAEALQRDPFLLFALRGKSRDQFLQDLRDMRGRDGARREASAPAVEDLGQFWRMGRLAESVLRPTGWGSGGDPARLVQSLGEPQLEGIREGLFLPMLESTYRQVSEGMRRLPKDG